MDTFFPPFKRLVLLCKHFLFFKPQLKSDGSRSPGCEEVVVFFILGFAYLVIRFRAFISPDISCGVKSTRPPPPSLRVHGI